MKPIIMIITAAFLMVNGCQNNAGKSAENKISQKPANGQSDSSACCDGCKSKTKTNDTGSKLACKLTSPELQKRKATIIASLKKQMIESKEITNAYVFNFPGNDKMLDELMDFIKTERQCCDFLTFNLSVSDDKSDIWLELGGKEGAKEFIKNELGL